jgi:UDP-glucuronate decarboxylase
VNLGNPGEFSIRELAEKVVEVTGSHSKFIYKPLPEDDPVQRQPDITRAKTQLGWKPEVSLDEGLKPTVAYFQSLM